MSLCKKIYFSLPPVILSVTLLGAAAVRVSLALVTAALQRVANISLLTPTVGSVIRPDLESYQWEVKHMMLSVLSPRSPC